MKKLIVFMAAMLFLPIPLVSAQESICQSSTIDMDGKFSIGLLGSNGYPSDNCRFTQYDYEVLNGEAKLIAMDEYTLHFDATKRGKIRVNVLSPTAYSAEFDIGSNATTTTCASPLVSYQGQCVDPIPACKNPPANYTTCIDKIENGKYIERYSFQCRSGHQRSGDKCVSTATTVPSQPPTTCTSPYVPYQGQCVDPIPACKNPPANYTTCIDKIENGNYIERYNYNCKAGYEKIAGGCFMEDPTEFHPEDSGITPTCASPLVSYQGQCVDPIPACKNPPANYLPSSCIDKIQNGEYLENYNFQCMPGYEKVEKKCVSATTGTQTSTKITITESASGFNSTTNEYYISLEWTPISGASYAVSYIIMDPSNSMLIGKSPSSGGLTQPFTSISPVNPGYKYVLTLEAYNPSTNVFLGRATTSILVTKNTSPGATTTKTNNTIIPPAGYEDEVRTAYSTNENPFEDTNTQNLVGIAAAELYNRAIIGGYRNSDERGKPLFDDDKPVNRAEAAKFLLLARGVVFSQSSVSRTFSDVLPGAWYEQYVNQAANLGIIEGYSDGTFRPAETVQRVEFLAMLARTFNLTKGLPHSFSDVPSDAWFNDFAGLVPKYNLIQNLSNTQLEPGKKMTRGDVAVAIYQYLKNR